MLANFIVEWTKVQMPPAVIDQEYWMMYFDGSLMKKGAGLGLVFISPLGVHMSVGDIPPGTTRCYMGRTIRGGPARKIKTCIARL